MMMSMKSTHREIGDDTMKHSLAAALAAFFLAGAATAFAAAPAAADSGRTFGQHVASCAKAVGFDGDHNPGMHQGRSGWDGATCPH